MSNRRPTEPSGWTDMLPGVRRLVVVVGVVLVSLWFVGPVGALPVQDLSYEEIAAELEASGSYIEFSSSLALDSAISRSNDSGVAFVWFDSDDPPEVVAESVSDELAQLSSPYRTVLVVTESGFAAWSETASTAAIDAGLDASFNDFADGVSAADPDDAAGANAAGIDAFVAGLSAQSTTAATSGSSSSDSGGGGIGLGSILLIAALGGGGFLLFRSVRSRSKAKKHAAADLEADRAEIKEQLRDNADHVLSLGDRVIASKNAELQALYEKSSAAYQHVSQSIDGATTATEIDELDDRIDQAEWELESIDARLEGRPVPPSPAEIEAEAEAAAQAEAPPPPAGRTDDVASGPDESVPRGGRAPGSRSRYQPQRRGGMGGGLGGLGSILGSIVFGGGLGGRSSRRTRRRTTSVGSIGRTRRSSGSSLGGGVLRRGGSSSRSSSSRSPSRRSSSRRSSSSRSRSRRGSSRSFGKKRGRGGGRRF